MEDNNNKGGKGKTIAKVIAVIIVIGLTIFLVMGAIRKTQGGPGGGPGGPGQGPGGPGQGPGREGGSITLYEEAAIDSIDYVAV